MDHSLPTFLNVSSPFNPNEQLIIRTISSILNYSEILCREYLLHFTISSALTYSFHLCQQFYNTSFDCLGHRIEWWFSGLCVHVSAQSSVLSYLIILQMKKMRPKEVQRFPQCHFICNIITDGILDLLTHRGKKSRKKSLLLNLDFFHLSSKESLNFFCFFSLLTSSQSVHASGATAECNKCIHGP